MSNILHLVIVAGHAIFQHSRWYGGFDGEDGFYQQHVEAGVSLSRSLPASCLCFSGGHTRPNHEGVRAGHVTNSEAAGMLEYANTLDPTITKKNAIVEEFARDSFENVFLSMIACFRQHGSWPTQVHVVSWPFKANRYYLIACGLRLGDGRFLFHGSGDLLDQRALESVARANVEYEQGIVSSGKIVDPLHLGPAFRDKRLGRMPSTYRDDNEYMTAVKFTYDPPLPSGGHALCPVSDAIEALAKASTGEMWRHIQWPWVSSFEADHRH